MDFVYRIYNTTKNKLANWKIFKLNKAILLEKEKESFETFIRLVLSLELVSSSDFYRLGGFGEVRKCSNKKTGAIRAVKIIKKESLDAKDKARFFTEIEIMRNLDHPNIVRLFEVF